MSFSRGQQAKYRPLVERAWSAVCERTGIPPNDKAARNNWYREQLHEAAGVFTTKQCNKVKDFDKVMLHFAIIANDEYWIGHLSNSDERRIFRRLHMFMQDLEWLEKEPVTWEYVRGIYKQAGMLPERMRDTPAETLRTVLQMLDTHIRRLCKDYVIRPCELPTRTHPAKKPIKIKTEAKHLRVGHDLDFAHQTQQANLPF